MENKETNLRQADAVVKVEGVVSENNLDLITTDNGRTVIRGDLVIQVGDMNFVTIQVYVDSLKKDETVNPAFNGVKTVMETYKSVAEVGVADATRVRINRGNLRPNTYFDQSGIERNVVRYAATYFNSLRNGEELTPSADFEVEVVISNIRPEVYTSGENLGDETGRMIVQCWLPTYDGIEPLVLVAPQTDGIADAVSSMFEKGHTVRFFGNIVSNRIERIREKPVVIGKPKVEKITSYVNELLITGASAPYEEEPANGNPAAYNLETISAAVKIREEKLEEKKREAANRPNNSSSNNSAPINKPSKPASRVLPF